MTLHDPYHAISRYLIFADRDQYSWWKDKGRLLSQVLRDSKYSEEEQYQYLSFFALHLIPALGPCSTKLPNGEWSSLMSGSGRLEYSLSYTKSKRSVRIAFEPTSFLTGTKHDQFNKRRTGELLKMLEKLNIDLDSTLYHRLYDALIVSDEEEEILKDREGVEQIVFKTQNILALKLQDGSVIADLYVYPNVKSLATGISTSNLLWNAIKLIDSSGRFSKASTLLKQFLQYQPPTASLMFLSCDLVAPSRSSVRLFVAESNITWERIEVLWTLGGFLKDSASMRGLGFLQTLWKLMKLQEGQRNSDEFPVLFTYGLSQNEPFVHQKIGIPMSALSELSIGEATAAFFEEIGWKDHGADHIQELKSYYPESDLSQHLGKQAWIAFQYSDTTGPQFTVHHY